MPDAVTPPAPRPRLPSAVWALGFVSLLTDVSSEMVHGLLPTFLVSVLGAGAAAVGLIEGLGEATAAFAKLFSGWLSDRLGKRKGLTLIGYGLGALSKPLFAVAPTASLVLAARVSDRIGKGIRGAPRDALITDLTDPKIRGAAFGLRQSLDTVGAFVGPLAAVGLMAMFNDNYRLVFWLAVIPGLASVAVLALSVREPPQARREASAPIRWSDLAGLGGPFWLVTAIGAIFTLARFSEAFLILKASDAGLALELTPLVLVVMNVVYAGAAYPVGALSDRLGRGGLLAVGFTLLIAADLVLGLAPGLWAVLFGVALWGLHMGATQGLLAALVGDTAPADRRGTAYGVFNAVGGIATLLASVLAGALWQTAGPRATFLAGAAFTAAALLAMALVRRRPAA